MSNISKNQMTESYKTSHVVTPPPSFERDQSNGPDVAGGVGIKFKQLLVEEEKDEIQCELRYFTMEEVHEHNILHKHHDGSSTSITSFWCCIDGFVVDATDYLKTRVHPGGQTKVLQTNDAKIGNDNKPMSFSFSKGKNAHFPQTAKIFQDGVDGFLNGGTNEIVFPQVFKKNGDVGHGGKIYILGRLICPE